MARRILKTRVTHLEMTERLVHAVPMPVSYKLALMRASKISLPFYRFLYEQVGKSHHWAMRRDVDDATLAAMIHRDNVEIHVLYVDGSPGGFFEIVTDEETRIAEILYFGLVPEFQGLGLARFFLNEAILTAWMGDPEKIRIETNTLDSPRALQLYQRMGFRPVSFADAEIEAWD
ncbi:GNAT family N-acetyltransferase [Phyllobacterium sp. 0TCS1.6C]|jgi:GNAT superfamily N-acetyltransferase|uniref:GNAT family N-acetyltransferase n=1 Tax=unclassified Phyllobacterium TaxID=2638441 RepID=UPI002264E8A5|nr:MULTISPECIES: GNAT family N-acetyltransferase [unclassified Phyllobacterium]MCX8282559.1 GNAT family N-acetyltransferase [Phyllobacterium sp. 0TCS1.6C]MCX8292509.1 GNAT family N-acetyltransferase [Phyllobacterium sp. 0TCS1.6A]